LICGSDLLRHRLAVLNDSTQLSFYEDYEVIVNVPFDLASHSPRSCRAFQAECSRHGCKLDFRDRILHPFCTGLLSPNMAESTARPSIDNVPTPMLLVVRVFKYNKPVPRLMCPFQCDALLENA